MLAIATYVLLSVISVTSAVVALDSERKLTEHIENAEIEEAGCMHDMGDFVDGEA